jgi:hypothetical protein
MSNVPNGTGKSVGLGKGDLCPREDCRTVCGNSLSVTGKKWAIHTCYFRIAVRYYFINSGLEICVSKNQSFALTGACNCGNFYKSVCEADYSDNEYYGVVTLIPASINIYNNFCGFQSKQYYG